MKADQLNGYIINGLLIIISTHSVFGVSDIVVTVKMWPAPSIVVVRLRGSLLTAGVEEHDEGDAHLAGASGQIGGSFSLS